MERLITSLFLVCGAILTLAALPAFGQNDARRGIEVNKMPLRDFGRAAAENLKTADLNASFLVELKTTLTADGKFDAQKSKVRTEGDPKLAGLAKELLAAVSDSGLLAQLRALGMDDLSFLIRQDDAHFAFVMRSPQASEEKARTLASALNTAVSLGRAQPKDEDERVLLGATKVAAEGEDFTLNLTLPKETFQSLVRKQLDKYSAKKQVSEQP